MSNGSAALPLALGAGGGLLLWYLLRDGKHVAHAPTSTAANANTAPSATAVAAQPTASAAPSSAPAAACQLRLDREGLTADGARVGLAEAVQRCQLVGRADVTVTEDASATAYAVLMIGLDNAGVPADVHRNAGGWPRNARARTADDVDLLAFVSTIRSLADHIEPDPNPAGLARGRFGTRKVFIAAIWRALRTTDYADLPRAVIDELLLRAHLNQLLTLARADLVAAMDANEVRDSEIKHWAGARFHFIVNERDGVRR